MINFLRPYFRPVENLEDLVLYEKTNLIIFSIFYYTFSVLMFGVSLYLFPSKLLHFMQSILGVIYYANVIGFSAGATVAFLYSRKMQAAKSYVDLTELKKKFYLRLYLASGVPFMALIAWAIVYADLRFAFEMVLAFVATVGALYFGDWKGFKSYQFN